MSESILNDVIAERKIYLQGAKGKEPQLVLLLGRPFRDASGYFSCGFQFVGQGSTEPMYAAGADAIDAIIAALAMMGTTLKQRNETVYNGKLCWMVDQPGELYLPTVEDHWPFKKIL